MPDYLQKIVYLTKEQYNQLITSQNQTITVGSTTHQYNANNLYFTTDDNIAVTDLGDNFILPVTKGGTGKNQFTTGSLLVGQGAGATQFGEISATNVNTPNTIVKRDADGNFSAVRVGLTDTYANLDLTNFRLDVHGPIRSYSTTTNNRLPMTSGLTGLPSYGNAQKYGTIIYSNGISMRDPYTGAGNDCGFIRHVETTTNSGYLEIGVGDDGNEPIYARQYNTSSNIARTVTLLDASGNSAIPGTLYLGSGTSNYISSTTYTGNAATANALIATPITSLNTQELIDGFIEPNKIKYGLFKTSEANNVGMASNDGMLLSLCWSSTSYAAQIALDDVTSGVMKFRARGGNTWGDWKTVAHSENVDTGDNNGQVKIAGKNISVKGLGTAAYTASSDYATSEHKHGNLNNDGTIGTEGKKKLVIVGTDNKVTTGAEMDTSTTNQWLNKKGEWSTPPDEKVKITALTSGTTYYPILATAADTATRQADTTLKGLSYISTAGTTAAVGTAVLALGNTTTKGTANNEQGVLRLYGTTAKYVDIKMEDGLPADNRTLYLPSYANTMYMVAATTTDAVGSTAKPVYIDNTGAIQECSDIGASACHADSYFIKSIVSVQDRLVKFTDTASTVASTGIAIDSNNNITTPGSIYFGVSGANKALFAYSSSYTKYGIWYSDESKDVMAFSASGNGDSKTNADFAIKGGGTLYNKGNIIPNTGNSDGSVGGEKQPVYINAGVITAGTSPVYTITWDSDSNKLTKTIGTTTTDVVTAATLKSAINVTASDLGLSTALRFVGTTTSSLSDNATTSPIVIGGNDYTQSQGDVVLTSDGEYLWNGSRWDLLGDASSFKKVQMAVSTVTAETTKDTTFVSSVTQNEEGIITVKTRAIKNASTDNAGIIKIGNTANDAMPGNKTVTNVSYTSTTDDASFPILMKNSTGGTTTAGGVKFNADITINPNSGTITATTFSGNATTATKWANARQVYVALGTTSTGTSLNGTASTNVAALGIGVNGTLGVGNGGTGVTSSNDIFATYGVEYIEGTQTRATNEWTGNTNSASLYVGKVIAYKLPWPGNSSNATLNLTLSGGTKTGAKNVYAGNTQLKTHYPANSIMIMVWNGTEWRTNPYYFEDENSKLRTYASLTNLDVPLLAGNASASTTATWTDYIAGSQYLYGAIPNDKTKHATINLSTGHVTIPGGITGNLTGNADTATKFSSTRKIELTGAITGSATTDGNEGWTISTSVNHGHGNITSDGKIGTAGKKKIVIVGTDNAITTGAEMDASTTTLWLNKKGEWSAPSPSDIGASATGHKHPVSDLTWAGGINLAPTATANNQEWSIDLTPGTYTGTYWHVWSAKTSATILACYTDDRHVTMPGNIASTSTTSGTLQVTGGIGATGQVTALRLAANGSNTSYSLYANGNSYLVGETVHGGNIRSDTTRTDYLGTSSYYWNGAYINYNGNIHWNNLTSYCGQNVQVAFDSQRGLGRWICYYGHQSPSNRLFGVKNSSTTVEYTTNNGSTWSEVAINTDSLFNGKVMSLGIQTNAAGTTSDQYDAQNTASTTGGGEGAAYSGLTGKGVRVTINMAPENRIGYIDAFLVRFGCCGGGNNAETANLGRLILEYQSPTLSTWTTIYDSGANGSVWNGNDLTRIIYPSSSLYLRGSSNTANNIKYLRITLLMINWQTNYRYLPRLIQIQAFGGANADLGTAAGNTGSEFTRFMVRNNEPYLIEDYATGQLGFDSDLVARSRPTEGQAIVTTDIHTIGTSARPWLGIYGKTIQATTGVKSAANTPVYADLVAGNASNVNSNTAHAEGRLYLYSAATRAHVIKTTSTTTEFTHYLPNSTGWIVTGGNGVSSGEGNATHPVFLSTTGVLTQCSGTLDYSISGSSTSCTGNAATATAIQTGGTTAQFYRGDNSWSNTLSGDLLIGNITAYNSNAQGSFIGTKAISCCFSNTENLSTSDTGYYLYGNGFSYATLRIAQIGTTTQTGICRLTLGTGVGTGFNGNASGEITLYNNTTNNSYATLSTCYNSIGTSMPATRIYSANGFVMPENKIGILFKTNSDSYYTNISYQTGGNQALVFGTKNSVTSFIFINGEDPVNISSTRWQSLTPALQIKDNSVYIGELIANGSTPSYKFKVTGSSYFNGATTMNGHLAFTHTSSNAPGYITWRSDTVRQRIQVDDNSTTNDAVFTFKQSEDSGTTYKDLFIIKDNGNITLGTKMITTQPTGTETSSAYRITITPSYYTGPWYIVTRDDATYANLLLKFGDGELMKVRRDGAVTIGNIRICTGGDSGPSRTISTVGDTNLLILSPYQKGVVFRQNNESGTSENKIWIVGDQLYPEAHATNNAGDGAGGYLGTSSHRWKELYMEADPTNASNGGIRFYTTNANNTSNILTGSIGANTTGGVGIYSNGALYFRTALSGSTAGMQMNTTTLYPSSNDTLDLGDTSHEWKNTYSKKFIVEQHVTMQWNSTDQSLDFIFA